MPEIPARHGASASLAGEPAENRTTVRPVGYSPLAEGRKYSFIASGTLLSTLSGKRTL